MYEKVMRFKEFSKEQYTFLKNQKLDQKKEFTLDMNEEVIEKFYEASKMGGPFNIKYFLKVLEDGGVLEIKETIDKNLSPYIYGELGYRFDLSLNEANGIVALENFLSKESLFTESMITFINNAGDILSNTLMRQDNILHQEKEAGLLREYVGLSEKEKIVVKLIVTTYNHELNGSKGLNYLLDLAEEVQMVMTNINVGDFFDGVDDEQFTADSLKKISKTIFSHKGIHFTPHIVYGKKGHLFLYNKGKGSFVRNPQTLIPIFYAMLCWDKEYRDSSSEDLPCFDYKYAREKILIFRKDIARWSGFPIKAMDSSVFNEYVLDVIHLYKRLTGNRDWKDSRKGETLTEDHWKC